MCVAVSLYPLSPSPPSPSSLPLSLSSLPPPSLPPPSLPNRQLLNECGIGVHSESESSSEACISGGGAVVSQHRVLLFCQYKTMLDIIEKDLLK